MRSRQQAAATPAPKQPEAPAPPPPADMPAPRAPSRAERHATAAMEPRGSIEAPPQQAAPTPAPASAPKDEPEVGYAPPEMGPGYDRIVQTAFAIDDPWTVYEELKRELSYAFDATQADYGHHVNALDRAESNAQRAAELLVNAKVTYKIFDIDANVFEGAMREQAITQLQAEKAAGTRSKAITNDDVEACVSAMFPDQYRDTARRRAEAKGTVDAIESLANRCHERARDLRAMVTTARGGA